jgi:RHS repeat-associated protein
MNIKDFARAALGCAAFLCGLVGAYQPATASPNPDYVSAIWVAQSDGVLKLSTDSGGVLFEMDAVPDVRVVAVDDQRGLLWAYGQGELRAYDFSGAERVAINVSAPDQGHDDEDDDEDEEEDDSSDDDGHVDLGISAEDGSVWLGVDKHLRHFNAQGELLGSVRLEQPIRALTIDQERGRIWVATEKTLAAYDADAQPVQTIALARGSQIEDISFDASASELWVALKDELRRFDVASGDLIFQQRLKRAAHIASAGGGELWVATDKELTRLDASGVAQFPWRSFSGKDKIIDLVADAAHLSAWVAAKKSLVQVSPQGEPLNRLEFERKVQDLAVYTDQVPPLLTRTSPPSGAFLNSNSPALSFGHSDNGIGVNPASLAVSRSGADNLFLPLGVHCTHAADASVCVPIDPLQEGYHSLIATIQDYAGNVSAPATADFTVDTVPPVITVESPVDGLVTAEAVVPLAGELSEFSFLTVNGHDVALDASHGFTDEIPLEPGANTIALVATDRAGNVGRQSVSVTQQQATPPDPVIIPPDPASVAPKLPEVGSPPLSERIAFLYTGTDPIQREIAPGTIEARRVAVLRGVVHDRAGAPIPGVKITVLHHPEFGHTYTRADGFFDLAVNGGGLLTVVYQKSDLLPAQRNVQTQWNDWFIADDVVMIPLDPKVTRIDLTDTSRPFQVAQGSVVEDSDGRRQVTVLFPAGTTAEITRPDGSEVQLTQLDFRATEYTVGASGPAAMPAPLPPTSAYTYAVELSVDQARQQGIKVNGKDVVFNQPVSFYLDNFLDFPVGAAVPVGYYNADIAAWVPYPNGRIVKVLREESGRAVLDVSGNGQPASAEDLTALGISEAELAQLAEVYEPGVSLWRVALSHFSTWDHNWPNGPPPDAEPPDPDLPEQDDLSDSDEESKCKGCIISPQARTLGESIPIAGTIYALHYQSERASGFGRNSVTIPLTGDSIPASLQTVSVTITVAGQREVHNFVAAPNLSHTFEWDGRDAMGRTVVGSALPEVELSYIYPCRYLRGDNGFSRFGNVATPIGTRDRCQGFVFSRKSKVVLRSPMERSEVVANWSLSAEHSLDANDGLVLGGDGRRRLLAARTIERVAGTGRAGFSGDGGPAMQALLRSPRGIAIAADGSVYVADTANSRIRRVALDGAVDTVAGTGVISFSGDGGPASLAALSSPVDVAIGADGSVYFADSLDHRIRRISTAGIIDTVAGTGLRGFSGDGGPAARATFDSPHGVAVATDGSIYIADSGNQRIRRVAPDGTVNTIAGSGVFGFSGDGDLAVGAAFRSPVDVAAGADGSLYISDSGNHRIRHVTSFGTINTIAGSGVAGFLGDGESATLAALAFPESVAVDAGGVVYIADTGNQRIRSITLDGIIHTISGTGSQGLLGDNGPSEQAQLNGSRGLAFDARDRLYISDTGNHMIRRITADRRIASNDIFAIPSDRGTQRFVFDVGGRHLRTEDARTGRTLVSFGRDAEGRVLSVTDADGNVTTIERNAGGKPAAIIAPHGLRTRLDVNGTDRLAQVIDPTGAAWGMQYTDDGLLTSVTDPNGDFNTFIYDADGRLLRDADPEGGGWQISRADLSNGSRTTMTSGEGRVRAFSMERLGNGARRYTDEAPDGSLTRRIYTDAGTTVITQSDGTDIVTKEGPDPRFKMDAPVAAERQIRLPAGQHFQQTTTRSVALAKPDDALSLLSLTDTVTTNGRIAQTAYDAAARRWTFTSAESRVSTVSVDDQSRPLSQTIAGLAPVATGYDRNGRPSLLQVGTDSEARQTRFDYYYATAGAQAGYLHTVTDAIGRQTVFSYDAAGRPSEQTLPDGRSIGFQYDAQGNLLALTPPGRFAHVFEYDGRDQATAYTPPDVSGVDAVTRYHYNLDRQVTRIERPDGATVGFGYNAGGRLASRTLPTGSTTYGYQAATGQLAAVDTSDGVAVAFAWNGVLPTSTTWSGPVSGSVSHLFDDNLWLVEERVAVDGAVAPVCTGGDDDPPECWDGELGGAAVAFGYDADGLLVQAGQLGLFRDAGNGLITGTALGAIEDSRNHNGFGELAGRTVSAAGDSIYQVAYTRDKLGRIVEQSESAAGEPVATFAYAYDLAGRLTEVDRDGGAVERYSYDANSNRATRTTLAGTTTYTYDEQDRLLAADGPGGVTAYTSNAAGELRTKSAPTGTTAYTYDAAGNLRAVAQPDGTEIAYLIDGLDRRIGKQVNGTLVKGWLYHDQLNPVAELDGAGQLVARFVYADQANVPAYMVKGGVIYRIVSDHLGSPRLVIDAGTGEIAQRMDYDAFGNVTLDTNPSFQPFGFAGGLYDPDTGLVRFGARDYDPEVGRWTAKDPISFAGGDPNLYGHVVNDPVNLIDPDGRFILNAAGAILGGFSGGVGAFVASRGDFGATVRGALSGALVGAINPVGGILGSFLGGSLSSLAGQYAAGRNGCGEFNIDPSLAALSGLGGAAGSVAGRAIVGANVGAITETGLPTAGAFNNFSLSYFEGAGAGAAELAAPAPRNRSGGGQSQCGCE